MGLPADFYANTATRGARRIRVGHCPECGRALAVFNNGEAWPLVDCPCGFSGETTALVNSVRFDDDFRVSDGHGPERHYRPPKVRTD